MTFLITKKSYRRPFHYLNVALTKLSWDAALMPYYSPKFCFCKKGSTSGDLYTDF